MNTATSYVIAAASEAQINFVKTLIAERNITEAQRTSALAECEAGMNWKRVKVVIAFLKAQPKKPYVAPTTTVTETKIIANAEAVNQLFAFDEGFYQVPKEISSAAGDKDFNILSYLPNNKKKYQKGVKQWKLLVAKGEGENAHGKYYPINPAQAKKMAAKGKKLDLNAAGGLGLSFNFCICCGRHLTDPISVKNGIGPVCAGKGWWTKGD